MGVPSRGVLGQGDLDEWAAPPWNCSSRTSAPTETASSTSAVSSWGWTRDVDAQLSLKSHWFFELFTRAHRGTANSCLASSEMTRLSSSSRWRRPPRRRCRHRLVERGDLAASAAIQSRPGCRGCASPVGILLQEQHSWPFACSRGRCDADAACTRWPLFTVRSLLRQRLRPRSRRRRGGEDSRSTARCTTRPPGRAVVDVEARDPGARDGTTFTSRHATRETAPPTSRAGAVDEQQVPLASAQSLTPWSGSRWRRTCRWSRSPWPPSGCEALVDLGPAGS